MNDDPTREQLVESLQHLFMLVLAAHGGELTRTQVEQEVEKMLNLSESDRKKWLQDMVDMANVQIEVARQGGKIADQESFVRWLGWFK